MEGTYPHLQARDIAGAMDWWRDAGVDCDFADETVQWVKEPEDPAAVVAAQIAARMKPVAPAEKPKPKLGGEKAEWPTDLAAFQQWWRDEPTLADTTRRIPPRGAAGAAVMIVVEQPEAADDESLLSGPQGKLLAGMLAAMGIDEGETYFASVLPRHFPLPDWDSLRQAGIDEILAHHVALVAPQRIIAFGGTIPSLLGNDPTQSPQPLQSFNHEGRTFPALFDRSLDALQRGKAKSAFWRRWLEWTGA